MVDGNDNKNCDIKSKKRQSLVEPEISGLDAQIQIMRDPPGQSSNRNKGVDNPSAESTFSVYAYLAKFDDLFTTLFIDSLYLHYRTHKYAENVGISCFHRQILGIFLQISHWIYQFKKEEQ